MASLRDRLAEAERVVEAAQRVVWAARGVANVGEQGFWPSVGRLREALDAYDREEADGGD